MPDFLHPTKKCDIVMEGGITSGVVYPNTVTRLAQTYRFVNIGGTSAGAIAAAATAAAEYRRAQGSGEGFARLSKTLRASHHSFHKAVSHNFVSFNSGNGLLLSQSTSYYGNTMVQNGASASGGVNTGQNLCNNALCS